MAVAAFVCVLTVSMGRAQAAVAATADASITSVAVDRQTNGKFKADAVVRIANYTAAGQVCAGTDPRCVVVLEAQHSDGSTEFLKTQSFAATSDPITVPISVQDIDITKVAAVRATISAYNVRNGDSSSAWNAVTDPYPVTSVTIDPSSTFTRTANGTAKWSLSAHASGFNEPDHVCPFNGGCYVSLVALYEGGGYGEIGRSTISGGASYPALITITGSDNLAKTVGWRVDLGGQNIQRSFTGTPAVVNDSLPDVSATFTVNRIWRTGDDNLGYDINARTTGIWQPNRPCYGSSSTSYFKCAVSLEGRQVESGQGVFIGDAPVVNDADYPVITNIKGVTSNGGGKYDAFRIRVGLSGTAINYVGPWQSVSDIGAAELRGGNNASENACPCKHADPIDSYTGAFNETVTDLVLPGVGPKIELSRTYSSTGAAGTAGAFGYGWTSGMEMSLTNPSSKLIEVRQENGAVTQFGRNDDGSFTPPARVIASLTYDSATSTYTFVRRAVEKFKFDANGKLLSSADLNGNIVTFNRDANGRVTSITGSGGRSINLSWTNGHVSQATDSAGRSIAYSYTPGGGELASVAAADGAVTSFTYDSAERLLTMTKPTGGVVTNTYNTLGQVASQTDPVGRKTTFDYDNGITTVTEPSGTKTQETYSGGLLIKKIVDFGGTAPRTSSFTWDANNNLVTSVDAAGQTSSATYDARGNALTRTNELGKVMKYTYNSLNQVLTTTDALARKTTSTYNSTGQQLTSVDPAGKTKTWTYDADGTASSQTDQLGKKTTFTYDSAGRPTGSTDPDARTRSVGYSSAGFVKTETDAAGKITTYTRDALGRALSVKDADANTTVNLYDGDGNLKKVTDARGHDATASYDAADQKTSSTDANGNTTSYTYAPNGKVKTTTDPRGNVTTNSYNAFDELTSVTDPLNRVTATTYDALSRPLTVTAPSGAVTKTAYDAAGQTTSTTDALGKITKYGYDAAGQQTSVTDPLNRVTKQAFSSTGLPTIRTLPGAATETNAYDAAGQLVSFTNADGLATSYVRDPAGLLMSKTEPGTMTTNYTYDAAARQRTVTTPDGHVTTNSYTDAGRLSRVHPDITGSTDITYTWDANGNRASMTDATGKTSYVYDNGDRLTASTNGAGKALAFGYNTADDLTTITYPGTKVVAYTHDAADQMTSLKDWANRTSNFTWTANGQLLTQAYANGITETRTYDAAGQLKQTKDVNGAGTALGTYGYGYDAAGQLTSDSSNDPLGTSTAHTYTYDTTSQLASIAGSGTTGTVTATPGGQLTKVPASTTLAYNAKQQVSSSTPAGGSATTFGYDGNGARTSSTVGSAATSYSYSAFGSLASATLPSARTVTFTSDGDNLRQSRTTGGVTKRFLWNTSGDLPLLLDDGDQSYVYGPLATPIAQIDSGGTVQYLHADLLGTPRLITSSTAVIAGSFAYSAYGVQAGRTGSATSNIGYTGNWTDPDTALVYLRARDYDSTTGQFLAVDPAVGRTRQPYAYVGNSPLSSVDPTGLIGWYVDGSGRSDAEKADEAFRGLQTANELFNPVYAALPYFDREIRAINAGCDVFTAIGYGLHGTAFAASEVVVGAVGAKVVGLAARAVARDAVLVPIAEANIGHMFRASSGHLAEDTAANRALLQSVVDPKNLRFERSVKQGGSVRRYTNNLPDGRQVWVDVHDGQITNGGVNG